MKSTNPRDVAYMFRDFARQLHKKAVPSDPYFVKISVICGKVMLPCKHEGNRRLTCVLQIEQWCEHHYPSFVALRSTPGGQSDVAQGISVDARVRIINRHKALAGTSYHLCATAQCKTCKNSPRLPEDVKHTAGGGGVPNVGDAATSDQIPWQLFAIVGGGFTVLTLVSLGILMLLMRYFD